MVIKSEITIFRKLEKPEKLIGQKVRDFHFAKERKYFRT